MYLKRIVPKSVGTHIFLYIIVALLVLSILLAGSMYIASQRLIITSAHNTSTAMMEVQANAYKQILNNQLQFAQLLYNSLSVKQLMTANYLRPYDLYVHYSTITNMVVNNDYIFSVYVFNRDSGDVYVMGQGACIRKYTTFYEQSFLATVNEMPSISISNQMPLTRRIVVPAEIQLWEEDQIGEVYSFIMGTYSPEQNNRLRGALVVNLYTGYQLLTSAGQGTENAYHFYMLDDAGRVVSSTESGRFLEDWSTEPAYSETLSGQNSGSAVFFDAAGEKMIVTYLQMPEYGRTLVSLVPYEQFASQVNVLGASTLLILICSVALGLMLSIVLSRRIVQPFSAFFRQVSGAFGREDSTKAFSYDDLKQFAAQTAQQYERLNHLERFRLQNNTFLKEYRLRRLLERETAELAIAQGDFDQPGTLGEQDAVSMIDVARPVCFVYMVAEEVPEASLNDYVLQKLVEELMPGAARWELIALSRYRWLLVYQAQDSADLPVLTEDVVIRLQELQRTMRDMFSQRVACALKTDIPEATYWHASMRQVEKRMEQRYLSGYDTVITQAQPYNPDWEMKPFIASVNQIRRIMLAGDAEALDEAWAQMRDTLDMASVQNARKAVDILSSSLFTTLLNMNSREVERIGFDYAEVAQLAEEAKTLDDALLILRKIPVSILQRSESKIDTRNAEIVTYAKDYIDKNLSNTALNYAMIADSLRISGTNLKRIFHQQTGITLSTYIRDVRLNKAERALVESATPIEEVLDNVGWENKKYFFTVFKKIHGITPSEYRLQMNINEGSKQDHGETNTL